MRAAAVLGSATVLGGAQGRLELTKTAVICEFGQGGAHVFGAGARNPGDVLRNRPNLAWGQFRADCENLDSHSRKQAEL